MFRYRRSLDGDAVIPVKDYPLDAAFAPLAKPGMLVKLVGGELEAAVTGDTTVLGVLEGTNFEGLGVTPKTGKVRVSPDAIYEADFVGGAVTGASIGFTFGIDSNHNLDIADTTVTIARVVEIVNGKPYVRINARQLG